MPITDELMRAVQQERRERIATAALAGALAYPGGSNGDPGSFATYAVKCADALIAELDKVKP